MPPRDDDKATNEGAAARAGKEKAEETPTGKLTKANFFSKNRWTFTMNVKALIDGQEQTLKAYSEVPVEKFTDDQLNNMLERDLIQIGLPNAGKPMGAAIAAAAATAPALVPFQAAPEPPEPPVKMRG